MKKSTLLLAFGPAEVEVFKKLDKIDGFSGSKSEIFRRGLHAAGYLADLDELSFRSSLIATLSISRKSPDIWMNITNAKTALTLLLAVSAIKKGPNKDQFLDYLLQQLETYREALAKYLVGKDPKITMDHKDPFIQRITDSLAILGEAMTKVYNKDAGFIFEAHKAIYPK